MDDSDLPPDLRMDWRKHMRAWSEYSDFLNNLKNISLRDAEELDIRGSHAVKEAEISATWFEVLEIAGDNYGAFPAGAY